MASWSDGFRVVVVAAAATIAVGCASGPKPRDLLLAHGDTVSLAASSEPGDITVRLVDETLTPAGSGEAARRGALRAMGGTLALGAESSSSCSGMGCGAGMAIAILALPFAAAGGALAGADAPDPAEFAQALETINAEAAAYPFTERWTETLQSALAQSEAVTPAAPDVARLRLSTRVSRIWFEDIVLIQPNVRPVVAVSVDVFASDPEEPIYSRAWEARAEHTFVMRYIDPDDPNAAVDARLDTLLAELADVVVKDLFAISHTPPHSQAAVQSLAGGVVVTRHTVLAWDETTNDGVKRAVALHKDAD